MTSPENNGQYIIQETYVVTFSHKLYVPKHNLLKLTAINLPGYAEITLLALKLKEQLNSLYCRKQLFYLDINND